MLLYLGTLTKIKLSRWGVNMIKTRGYAAESSVSGLMPFTFERREPGEYDVLIKILYCGICHSDVHQVRNEWGSSIYPMVPGHEIVGKVIRVGAKVKRFIMNDSVGVGCMVDSCGSCHSCQHHVEQFCEQGATMTYNSYDKGSKTPTFGGYSKSIVVNENFVLKISHKLNLSGVAPLLCAGITTYSPLKYWKVHEGQKVGVMGIGGLGHMAIKLAHAFRTEVIVFTTSPKKRNDALRLGACEVVISTDSAQMKKWTKKLDFILDTISGEHDINQYLDLLKLDGTMVMVGLPEKQPTIEVRQLLSPRRKLTGSLIGGIAETQEMLDFCARHDVLSDVELIPIQKINEAYERLIKGDVKYRFVIDMNTLVSE